MFIFRFQLIILKVSPFHMLFVAFIKKITNLNYISLNLLLRSSIKELFSFVKLI